MTNNVIQNLFPEPGKRQIEDDRFGCSGRSDVESSDARDRDALI